MTPQVGQHYRSETTKVLMTIEEINTKDDHIKFRIADSDFVGAGPLSNFTLMMEEVKAELITEEQFNKYLETYTEDMVEQQRLELEQNYDKFEDVLVYYGDAELIADTLVPIGGVPVRIEFDSSMEVGRAFLRIEGDKIYANIHVRLDHPEVHNLMPGLGVDPVEGNPDKSFEVMGIGLVMNHKDLEDIKALKHYKMTPAKHSLDAHSQGGFSLLEVMTAIVLIGFILMATITFVQKGRDLQHGWVTEKQEFMRDCVMDKKKYECIALWKSSSITGSL